MMPEYYAWYNMHRRCHNESTENYHNYGGRGISVDAAWNDFAVFFADMGKRTSDKHSLDRIDNNGNYCKSNCRWATPEQQTENRRDNGTHKRQRNNTSGVVGVTHSSTQNRWAVIIREYGAQIRLYWGQDFFEACCIRKSWENRNARS